MVAWALGRTSDRQVSERSAVVDELRQGEEMDEKD